MKWRWSLFSDKAEYPTFNGERESHRRMVQDGIISQAQYEAIGSLLTSVEIGEFHGDHVALEAAYGDIVRGPFSVDGVVSGG